MNSALINDIEYYIRKKEKLIEFYSEQKKDCTPIKIEQQFLERLKNEINLLQEENFQLKIEKKKTGVSIDKKRIIQGLECALNYYSLSSNRNSNIAFILSKVLNDPLYFVCQWSEQLQWWQNGKEEIEWYVNNFSYYDLRVREHFKIVCETYGFDETLKLAKWKRKTDNRKKLNQ